MNEPPSWWRSGLNFAEAIARYVAAGCPNVTESQFRKRITTCAHCHMCRNQRCLACGCLIEPKAQMATEKCPGGYWPDLTAKQSA